MKKCPNCTSLMPDDVIRCIRCGFDSQPTDTLVAPRAAAPKKGRIRNGWTLATQSVGVLLRMIEERVGFIGKIVIAMLGTAWTIATYFVVPVLVVEKLGPLDALKRSAEIIKKSWGESLVSNLGIGLVTTLVTMLLIVTTAVFTIMLAVKLGSIAVALAGVALVLVIIVLAALVSSALSSIALCASYLYATEGKVPRAFADSGLQHALAPPA